MVAKAGQGLYYNPYQVLPDSIVLVAKAREQVQSLQQKQDRGYNHDQVLPDSVALSCSKSKMTDSLYQVLPGGVENSKQWIQIVHLT